jgi:hypothetical protein
MVNAPGGRDARPTKHKYRQGWSSHWNKITAMLPFVGAASSLPLMDVIDGQDARPTNKISLDDIL